jgi:hypothetical protein
VKIAPQPLEKRFIHTQRRQSAVIDDAAGAGRRIVVPPRLTVRG